MNTYPPKVFLNDKILDSKDAKISVFDRGFLFGDGIYEVMVQLNGTFFFGDAHLARLKSCLQKISIEFDIHQLSKKIDSLLDATNLTQKNCLLYIQVTRGMAPRKHAFPKNIDPTVMMYAIPFDLPAINRNSVEAVVLQDFRWHRCDIKTTSLLGNIMANTYGVSKNCYDTIFVRNGKVTEASHCNVFFVKNQIVYTHPSNKDILNGITRQIVIELCHSLGIEVREEAICEEAIKTMDEAFLTGTSTQIASIKKIDNHYFYTDEQAGSITKKLQNAFLLVKKSQLKLSIAKN